MVAATSLAQHYILLEAAVRAETGNEDNDGKKAAGLSDNDAVLVDFRDAAFSWSLDDDVEPTLTGLTFTLPRGKLVGVAGPIGSGKSSLLLALLGELRRCEGSVARHPDWHRPVAYMPQHHWLQTGTVRENVGYAPPESIMGPGLLQAVVEACGMAHDVADFPDGLDHFIGEAGSSLSGGQRARVSLARAVHAAAAITVLDDPCALDPGLGAEVFRRTMAPGGLLRAPERSVILVTTNPAMLAQCDMVAVVQGGTVTTVAPPAQLGPGMLDLDLPGAARYSSARIKSAKTEREADALRCTDTVGWKRRENTVEAAYSGFGDISRLEMFEKAFEERQKSSASLLYAADSFEDKEAWDESGHAEGAHGTGAVLLEGVDIKLRSRTGALLAALGWAAAIGGLLLVATQGLIFFWSVLVEWNQDADHPWFAFPRPFYHAALQNRCNAAVLASPYSFFSVNPASKIFGAIAADAQLVEQSLSVSMGAMWSLLAQLVGTVIMSIVSLWYLVFLFLPLTAVYMWIQHTYSACVTPLARAEAAARGPVSAAVSTTLVGLPVVRAFRRQDAARAELSVAVAGARGTSLAVINASGWLAFVSNVCIFNAINIVVAVALAVVLDPGPSSFGPTVMSNVASLSCVIGSTAMLVSNVEIALSSLQRLCLFSELPSEEAVVRQPSPEVMAKSRAVVREAGGNDGDRDDYGDCAMKEGENDKEVVASDVFVATWDDAAAELPEGWPSAGAVAYRRAYAAYVWGERPALRGVSIDIPAGSSCALVGRSGSGKSTAFLALTGMIPVVAGAVEIDGIAVERVPLRTLRAALAVVPQQPVLFAGPLRPNLDPQGQHGDAALWEALRAVGLRDAVTAAGGLGVDPLAAGMSQGQRQLLCLARALLRDCSILLLDEANSSVDAATERQMAVTVAAFGAGELTAATGAAPHRRTVIEVAHRLEGVLNMDQVVVLGAGAVLEAGPPRELAKKAGGEFAGMLAAQGTAI